MACDNYVIAPRIRAQVARPSFCKWAQSGDETTNPTDIQIKNALFIVVYMYCTPVHVHQVLVNSLASVSFFGKCIYNMYILRV